MKDDILIQNAKVAVEYWQRIANGEKHEDVKKDYRHKNRRSTKWYNFVSNNTAPCFESNGGIVEKKPKHWDLIQEYQKYAKDNPEEYKNWNFKVDGRWTPLAVAPSFSDYYEYRRNPVKVEKPKITSVWNDIKSYNFLEESCPKVDLLTRTGVIMQNVRITFIYRSLESRGDMVIGVGCGWELADITHWRYSEEG